MDKPASKASDGGRIDILRESEDVTESGLQQGSGREVLIRFKVRPEAFPTGSPMSALANVFKVYAGFISLTGGNPFHG